MKKMEDKQRRLIFAECRARGIDDDFRREIIESVTGKKSMKELSAKEAALVIDRICGKERNQNKRKVRTDIGGDPRTVKMRRKIYKLEEDLGWKSNPNRLKGHMARMHIYADINFLTPKQCFQVIESLKAMAKRLGIKIDY